MYQFIKVIIAGFIAVGLYGISIPETQAEWINPAQCGIPRGIFWGHPRCSDGPSDFETRHQPGTIIVRNSERRLISRPGERAGDPAYGVGVGRPGFFMDRRPEPRQHEARNGRIGARRPPCAAASRICRVFMGRGDRQPARVACLSISGAPLYRIHGSNEPHTIGQAVSSGCIRMTNRDVEHLYERVRVGARVDRRELQHSATRLSGRGLPIQRPSAPASRRPEPRPEVMRCKNATT